MRYLYSIGQRVQLRKDVALALNEGTIKVQHPGPGVVVKCEPEHGGYLVEHDRCRGPLGWMEYELEPMAWWRVCWRWLCGRG